MLEKIIGHGLTDLSRKFHPDDDRLFTWWAPWRQMRERNIGWRLDYVLAGAPLAEKAVSTESPREFGTSDHAPVTAVFDVPIERAKIPDDITCTEQIGRVLSAFNPSRGKETEDEDDRSDELPDASGTPRSEWLGLET